MQLMKGVLGVWDDPIRMTDLVPTKRAARLAPGRGALTARCRAFAPVPGRIPTLEARSVPGSGTSGISDPPPQPPPPLDVVMAVAAAAPICWVSSGDEDLRLTVLLGNNPLAGVLA